MPKRTKYRKPHRLTYDGKTGWIYGKYLSAERGGPQYLIPNEVLDFEFGWY
jgi:hypothetical protein